MKRTPLFLASSLLVLTACASRTAGTSSLEGNLANPLFAKSYYADLATQMAAFEIRNDPMLKNERTKNALEAAREDAIGKTEEASLLVEEGRTGLIISDRDVSIGTALIRDNMLHFGSDFVTAPGPSLHVYLTDITDPRTDAFPDDAAVDLGPIVTTYGAQSFALPEENTHAYKTVVLWDTSLRTVYGFVQLEQ